MMDTSSGTGKNYLHLLAASMSKEYVYFFFFVVAVFADSLRLRGEKVQKTNFF